MRTLEHITFPLKRGAFGLCWRPPSPTLEYKLHDVRGQLRDVKRVKIEISSQEVVKVISSRPFSEDGFYYSGCEADEVHQGKDLKISLGLSSKPYIQYVQTSNGSVATVALAFLNIEHVIDGHVHMDCDALDTVTCTIEYDSVDVMGATYDMNNFFVIPLENHEDPLFSKVRKIPPPVYVNATNENLHRVGLGTHQYDQDGKKHQAFKLMAKLHSGVEEPLQFSDLDNHDYYLITYMNINEDVEYDVTRPLSVHYKYYPNIDGGCWIASNEEGFSFYYWGSQNYATNCIVWPSHEPFLAFQKPYNLLNEIGSKVTVNKTAIPNLSLMTETEDDC